MRKVLLFIVSFWLLYFMQVKAQNVGIGSSLFTPDASAGLEIQFSDKGLLIPRVSLTSTSSAAPITSPATSLLVYNTATTGDVTPGYYYWDGSKWVRFATIKGSGTANYLARWIASDQLGIGTTRDNGTTVGINNAPSSYYRLYVNASSSMTAIRGVYSSTIYGDLGTSNYGVYGQYNDSIKGRIGDNNNGVYGQYNSTRYGMLGNTAYGVYGQYNDNHYGFIGSSKYGVYGRATNSTAGNAGVYGYNGSGSWGALGYYNGTSVYAGYFSGNVYYTGTLSGPSDEKFKKNISDYNNALDNIMKLRPVTYEMKTDEYPFMNFEKGTQIGFIAQEMESIFPSLVVSGAHPGENDPFIEYKGINYIGLTPILVKALQEQQIMIDSLKSENNDLKSKYESLQKRLEEIESKLESIK
ncbi:MAG: tail fiber domain-containing protein [Bacteroidales bacterium]